MIRIMFVDDEKAIRDNLSSLVSLEDEGFQIVGTAMNGLDALEKLPKLRPNVIFLDVSMPVMDGLTFLKELKKSEFAKTEIVILSGYNDFEYAKTAMRYGARAYLSKPVDEDEMMAILREIKENRKDFLGEEQEDSNLLEKVEEIRRLYRGGVVETDQFKVFFVMHLVVLSEGKDEGMSPDLLKDVFNSSSGCNHYGLIRSMGCVYTYLVKKQVLKSYHNDYSTYAEGMVLRLRASSKACAVLIDSNLFNERKNVFRREFDSHLYTMMSELFYNAELTSYVLDSSDDSCKPWYSTQEESFLMKIKNGLQVLDWKQIESSMELLFTEIKVKKIPIEYVEEIRYRLYYLVVELYPDVECHKYDFWDQACFNRFPQWKKIQMEWQHQVFLQWKEKVKENSLGGRTEVVSWVKQHYRESITIKQAADQFYMNTAYMGRMFQKLTGSSFNQYVNELRLNEAKRLLGQTDKMIYEIADEVGYTESKYFISKFTEKFGISPSEYRKQNSFT